ncbi:MAG TPA: L-threonylcarbamoyladenylate synthase [Thermoanaerobaculia bacterium]|nr:L-threonylcarbamoyladenylate synthase [Thermoanaerobaculia bacterium]
MRRVSIDELNASREETFRLRELLGNGGVVALPTETFYGLAADPWSEAGVSRICRMKGREAVKALPVLFATRAHLDRLGIVASPQVLQAYFQIWPAPLTAVFDIRQPIAASRGLSKLGVRMPSDRKLRTLLGAIGPVTGTSVNRSGSPPLDNPDAVETLFRRDVDWLIDGGRTPGGKPSTVVDATAAPPAVLRQGAYVWARGEGKG